MSTDNMKHRRLQELGESDFEIVAGQPDIRGWDVFNEANTKLARVDELILDAQQRKVRYMVLKLDHKPDTGSDREVLVPIGLAQLRRDDDEVVLRGVTIDQILKLPDYDENKLDPEMEKKICSVLGRKFQDASAGMKDQDFYEHDYFDDTAPAGLRSSQTTGYLLRDRVGQSGTEVEGYVGAGLGRDRGNLDSGRTHIYRDEEIDEDAIIPVNRDVSRSTEEHLRRDLDDLKEENMRERERERERQRRKDPGDNDLL
jgi:hypothetical protein